MSNLNLKGIWIPTEILKDKNYINIELIYKEKSKQVEMRKLIPISKNKDTYLKKVKDLWNMGLTQSYLNFQAMKLYWKMVILPKRRKQNLKK